MMEVQDQLGKKLFLKGIPETMRYNGRQEEYSQRNSKSQQSRKNTIRFI